MMDTRKKNSQCSSKLVPEKRDVYEDKNFDASCSEGQEVSHINLQKTRVNNTHALNFWINQK